MHKILVKQSVAAIAILWCVVASAGDDYPVVNEMATCSSFYAHMRDSSDRESISKGYDAAESRVFARLAAEMGRETAIQMTRASWNTWRMLIYRVQPERWDELRSGLEETCRGLE